MADPLYLIDGTLFFFRGHFGVPALFEDERGRPVHGVLGYVRFLRNLLRDRRVRRALVAFDESLNTSFRNRSYPDYKANRPAADADIEFQLDACRTMTRLLGVADASDAEFEADDIIATVAARESGPAVVVTRDKDLKQLVAADVCWWDGAEREIDVEAFMEEFGFAPSRFADYQALTGDKIDNVPGVPGIGAKTAASLISRYDGLEGVRDALGSEGFPDAPIARPRQVVSRLEAHLERAFAMRDVLRLATDAPVAPRGDALAVREADVRGLAEQTEFLGLASQLAWENGDG